MNDGLKQRVVGAIVLVVMAVIFLPMLFDFSGERRIDKTSRIPQSLAIEPVVFERATRPENIQYPKPADRVYQFGEVDQSDLAVEDGADTIISDKPEIESEPELETNVPVPGLNDKGMLASWVVQVGAFKDVDRAKKLEQSLLDDGYKAYSREDRNRGLFFVYVGPEADKNSLFKVQKKIDLKYRLKSKILVFDA